MQELRSQSPDLAEPLDGNGNVARVDAESNNGATRFCTATLTSRGSTPASRSPANAENMTPRLVAPPRPNEPPTLIGLPVTTPVTV